MNANLVKQLLQLHAGLLHTSLISRVDDVYLHSSKIEIIRQTAKEIELIGT